jgi:hypothetical protein
VPPLIVDRALDLPFRVTLYGAPISKKIPWHVKLSPWKSRIILAWIMKLPWIPFVDVGRAKLSSPKVKKKFMFGAGVQHNTQWPFQKMFIPAGR